MTRDRAAAVLARIGVGAASEGTEPGLIDGALALAQYSLPAVDPAPYRQHVADLADRTAAVLARRDHVLARRDALHAALVAANGYHREARDTDTLDDANLFRVIDRRRGLPVALAILYVGVGRALGWSIAGIAFPGHVLVQIEHAGERRILDPVENLRSLGAPALRNLLKRVAGPEAELQAAHYAHVADRDLLLRLENSRKLRLVAQGRLAEALDALAAMRMLAPCDPNLWRETGVLHAQVGNLADAAEALEHALALGHDAATRQAAAELLDQIRGRMT